MMRRLAMTWVAAALVGCAAQPSPMVGMLYNVPGVSAPDASERYATPIGRQMRTVPGVAGVVTISTNQTVTAYLIARPGADAKSLAASAEKSAAKSAADSDLSKAGLALPSIAVLPGDATVPPISDARADQYDVAIDVQAAADAGLAMTEIDQSLASAVEITSAPPTEAGVDQLRQWVVRNLDGKRIHLGDIAAVSIRKAPVQVRLDF